MQTIKLLSSLQVRNIGAEYIALQNRNQNQLLLWYFNPSEVSSIILSMYSIVLPLLFDKTFRKYVAARPRNIKGKNIIANQLKLVLKPGPSSFPTRCIRLPKACSLLPGTNHIELSGLPVKKY